MMNPARLMKLFADTTRLRVIMVLARKELCVCQIMGVLGISQPLVSRNLAMLNQAGLIAERKEGKLVFYSLNSALTEVQKKVIELLQEMTAGDRIYSDDLKSLNECEKFQQKIGKCDMKTFKEFMLIKSKKMSADCERKG